MNYNEKRGGKLLYGNVMEKSVNKAEYPKKVKNRWIQQSDKDSYCITEYKGVDKRK